MEELRTPRFGNTPNQSTLKTRRVPLDDNQSISISCKETDTLIHIPESTCGVGACPASSLLDSSARAGLGAWSQKRGGAVQMGALPAAPAVPPARSQSGDRGTYLRRTSDPAIETGPGWDPHSRSLTASVDSPFLDLKLSN